MINYKENAGVKIYPVYENEELKISKDLAEYLKEKEIFAGKEKEIYTNIGPKSENIVLLGLGKKGDLNNVRKAFYGLYKNLKTQKIKEAEVVSDFSSEEVKAALVGLYQSAYTFDKYLKDKDTFDLDAARRTSGAGFYYLKGDMARLHSAILSYARDFMIDKGYTYYIPPYMVRSDVVTGVMSFAEMEDMMYKIEGEDLYLIGTSEHSMIGKFIGTINEKDTLPQKLTSYSPCFRKEVGAHGIEERGVYRIHQFEKQEMVVVCEPEDSKKYYDGLWKNTVEFFRTLDIPVRTLECCSGDLADLKVKSLDVEAWSGN